MDRSGRHFLQIPGPTNVPDRVLRAMDRPLIDHRSAEFATMALDVLENVKMVFKTDDPVIIYPASGTGAWEAALMNTLSPGDRVLMFESGQFATLWNTQAKDLGLKPTFVEGDWRHGFDPDVVEQHLRADTNHEIKAVCVVHNETSTGVVSRVPEIRAAMDRCGHPALLLVDTISSLGSIDYRHKEWKVDVTVAGSQKGLMLPPGLSFNAVSQKALKAYESAKMPRSYWDWKDMMNNNKLGFFPFTPATNTLFGLQEALKMIAEEGLENIFTRHTRHGEATRLAVEGWGLETVGVDARERSDSLTAVFVPEGVDADKLRSIILENFNMSLGTGLGKIKGRAFRIGHMGFFNDLSLAGTLSGVQMGLDLMGIAHGDGVGPALAHLARSRSGATLTAAR